MTETANYQEEVEKSILTIMMDVVEISEKFQKLGPKEVPSMATSALCSNRKHVILKRVLELESKIGSLRNSIMKGSIQAALKKEPEEKKLAEDETLVDKSKVETDVTTQEAPVEKTKKEKKSVPKEESKEKEKTEQLDDSKAEPKEEQKGKKKDTPTEDSNGPEEKKKKIPKESKKPKGPETKEVDATEKVEVTADVQPGGKEESEDPIHVRRKKIPKQIKTLVWNEYIGAEFPQGRCYCCQKEKIDQRNYHCGHVIAESKGGDLNIKNLRPICAACNASMGTQSMNEFTKTFFGREI